MYALLDEGDHPVREGEKVNVVGGRFAIGMLATVAEVRARWGGRIRSSGFVGQLPDEGPPLPTLVEIE